MWAKPNIKGGLYIRGQKGNVVVKRALIRYAKWLRLNFDFPIKLPVYLYSTERVKARDGDECVSIILLPWEPNEEPYIRMSTGDYYSERKISNRDNTLASYLHDLTKNILKYHYWVETGKDDLKNVSRKASRIIDKYALTTDHP